MHRFFPFSLGLASFVILPATVLAQSIEEITVTSARDTSSVSTADTLVAAPDTAQLLRNMPGASINKNGELTGIAQYRGMYGDRLNVSINGSRVSSGGPNAMDAPLHYAPVALLDSLTIRRGIVPVSVGQETIGGSVEAVTFSGDFTDTEKLQFNSRLYAGAQTVNEGGVASAVLTLANRKHLLRLSLLQESGDDSEFADGTITPSEYQRDRIDIGYSFRSGNHEFSIDLAKNNTGDTGNASLPMDIMFIDSELSRLRYQWQNNNFRLKAEFSANDIEHQMSNFHLRRPAQGNNIMPGPMLYRQAYAVSENVELLLQLEQDVDNGLWRYGLDGHYADHDTRITNPNAGAFYVDSFNDVSRDILGFFVEREMSLRNFVGFDKVALEAGARVNFVEMDAGLASANLNPMNLAMGMPVMMNNMIGMLAGQFNQQNHQQKDTNLDWFTRFSVETSPNFIWTLGLARKTRSPSYQERYLWAPLESTGGLADGKTYVGNVNLKPEIAHEIEIGFDWNQGNFSFYPRVFYKHVTDFVQGTPASNPQANGFAQMMENMGMGSSDPLQFTNVDATFYGLDLESSVAINEKLMLRAIFSMVRGKRDDINDDLYRVTPTNLMLGLDYLQDNWSATVETMLYAKQENVSVTNLEQESAGYALVNASARVAIKNGVELGFGINNLFDRRYNDHLAGYNRAYNPDIALRDHLPGLGRNIFARLMWLY